MRRMDKYMYDRMMRDERRRDRDYQNDYYQKRYDKDYQDDDYHFQDNSQNNDLKRKIKRLKRYDTFNVEENNLLQKAKQIGLNVDDEEEFKVVYYYLTAIASDVIGDSTKLMILTDRMLYPKNFDYDADELCYSILDLI